MVDIGNLMMHWLGEPPRHPSVVAREYRFAKPSQTALKPAAEAQG